MMPVRFLPQAEAELLHEVEYYSQTVSGTGIRFQAAVEASLERVSRHPLGGAPSSNGTRSVLFQGFPFSIIYRASNIELLVVAIAAHRRRPGSWMQRIA
jgi:toxin ParE1/3/4